MNIQPQTATLSGVFLCLWQIGVLLTGASGIGKSEAALELIHRGHRLIADDAVEFTLAVDGNLWGSCPPLLKGLLALRDVGVVDVRQQLGQHRIMNQHPLSLVIELRAATAADIPVQALVSSPESVFILGQQLPQYRLHVTAQRPLALLVECLVRQHQLKQQGFDSTSLFIENQSQEIGLVS